MDTSAARGDLLARRVVVGLVHPLHPGNVGAAARAMRNTGLSDLVLVDPPAFDPERARWMAPGCSELLAQARIVTDLGTAVEGCQVCFATTARHRRGRLPVLEPEELARRILDLPDGARAMVLFGREDFGLDKDSVDRCQALVRIPTPEHASLNLAQAVLLIGYALFSEARRRGVLASGRLVAGSRSATTTQALCTPDARDALADLGAMEPAVEDLVRVLTRVGYTRGVRHDKVAATLRGALQRALPSHRQLDAVRGMAAKITYALDHPETQGE